MGLFADEHAIGEEVPIEHVRPRWTNFGAPRSARQGRKDLPSPAYYSTPRTWTAKPTVRVEYPSPLRSALNARGNLLRFHRRPLAERSAEIAAPRILCTMAQVVANQCSIKSLGLTIRKSRSTIRRLAP